MEACNWASAGLGVPQSRLVCLLTLSALMGKPAKIA